MTAIPEDLVENLGAMRKAGSGIIIAAFEETIGWCCWRVLQTAQHGALGRLTLLFVGEAYQLRGVRQPVILDSWRNYNFAMSGKWPLCRTVR
jgi:hypothetical protein